MEKEDFVWFYLDQTKEDIKDQAQGPLSIRDLDILFRTNKINQNTYVCKQGMKEWKQVFEVDELKKQITEFQDDVAKMQQILDKEAQIQEQQNQSKKAQTKQQSKDVKQSKDGKQSQGAAGNQDKSALSQQSQDQQLQEKKKQLLKQIEGKKEQPGKGEGKAGQTGEKSEKKEQKQESEEKDEEEGEEEDEDEDDEEEEGQEEEVYLKTLLDNPEKALEMTVNQLINNKYYKGENGEWHIYDEVQKTWKIQNEEPVQEMKKMKEELLQSLKNEFFGQLSAKQETQESGSLKRKFSKNLQEMNEQEKKLYEKKKKKQKKYQEKKKIRKLEQQRNNFIYVKGLPQDITLEEMDQFFTKAGVIKFDYISNQKKIKLYKDEQGNLEGTALIGYEQEESVSIALEMLNDREIKPGYIVLIDRAKFDQNAGQFFQQMHEKKKIDKVQLMKLKQDQKKNHGWEEDDQIEGLKIVIIKNLFTKQEVDNEEPEFWRQLEQDLTIECQKIGSVQKIQIFDKNPEGCAKVKFSDAVSAEKCIEIMNGRYFDQRKLDCFYWDGQIDYNIVKETKEEEEKRIQQFGQFLNQTK